MFTKRQRSEWVIMWPSCIAVLVTKHMTRAFMESRIYDFGKFTIQQGFVVQNEVSNVGLGLVLVQYK